MHATNTRRPAYIYCTHSVSTASYHYYLAHCYTRAKEWHKLLQSTFIFFIKIDVLSRCIFPQRSELERLLAWQLPRCKKSTRDAQTAGTMTLNQVPLTSQTAVTAPPPTAPTAGNTFSYSNSISTAPAPEDVVELSELHLADDLLLRNVIYLPGLAKYFGMMCDAALAENTRLPDLEPAHICGSRGREAPDYNKNYVADKRDVQAFCNARETVAAAAASAFLNTSASAWDQCRYLVWKNHTESEPRDTSVQSYLSLNRTVIPAGLDLFPNLVAAEDFGLTPFVLYCYTKPDFLKEMAKSFEHIGTREEFSWTHCSPKDNTCQTPFCREYYVIHRDFPRSGRTAGPDSTIVRDIVNQIKSDVATKRGGPKPKPLKMLLARQALKKVWPSRNAISLLVSYTFKVWTKLVAINGTFAIIGDGQYEMICMRHRHLQTLFISPCHDVTRDPYDRTLPSQMRVRIGLNIIATLDLVRRATLWRNAAQIGVQVPTIVCALCSDMRRMTDNRR